MRRDKASSRRWSEAGREKKMVGQGSDRRKRQQSSQEQLRHVPDAGSLNCPAQKCSQRNDKGQKCCLSDGRGCCNSGCYLSNVVLTSFFLFESSAVCNLPTQGSRHFWFGDCVLNMWPIVACLSVQANLFSVQIHVFAFIILRDVGCYTATVVSRTTAVWLRMALSLYVARTFASHLLLCFVNCELYLLAQNNYRIPASSLTKVKASTKVLSIGQSRIEIEQTKTDEADTYVPSSMCDCTN